MFNKIKSYLKNPWILFWTYTIISIIVIIFYVNKYNDAKETISRKTNNATIDKTPTQTTNRAGDSIAQNKVYRYRIEELKTENEELYKKLEEYAKKGKGVQSYTEMTTETKGTISAPTEIPGGKEVVFVTEKDTIKSLPFKFKDEFISVSGEAFPSKVDFDYEYTSKTEIIHRWNNVNSFFKDPVLLVESKALNPKEKVTGLVSVQIEPPKKKFYQTTGFKIGVGVLLGVGAVKAIQK